MTGPPRRLLAVPGVGQSSRTHFAILRLDAVNRLKVTPNRASLYTTPIPVNLFISKGQAAQIASIQARKRQARSAVPHSIDAATSICVPSTKILCAVRE